MARVSDKYRCIGDSMNSAALRATIRKYKHIGEALKRDFQEATTPDGPMSAGRLAADLDKSSEWVWAVCRGEIALKVRDLLDWEEATGGIHAMEFISAQLGLLVVPFPQGDDMSSDVQDLIGTWADFIRAISHACEEGPSKQTDLSPIHELCLRCIQVASGLVARMQADVELARSGREKTLSKTAGKNGKRNGRG